MGLLHSFINEHLTSWKCMKRFFGLGTNKPMSNFAFKFMQWMMWLTDWIFWNATKRIKIFGIKKGDVVCDYACGPGRMLKYASELVGENGRVYACDIHPMAIEVSKEIVKKNNLKNVQVEKCEAYKVFIEDSHFDIVYALDMFHHVEKTDEFLNELCRICKKDGRLFIEGGHMTGKRAAKLIESHPKWKVFKNHGGFHHMYELTPKK